MKFIRSASLAVFLTIFALRATLTAQVQQESSVHRWFSGADSGDAERRLPGSGGRPGQTDPDL